MPNDARYFPHDANARRDPRLVTLRLKMGWEGIGLYWAFIEKLRESSGFSIPLDYEMLEDEFRVSQEKMQSFLDLCFKNELLVLNEKENAIKCKSLENRMSILEEIRQQRVKAGKMRWEKWKEEHHGERCAQEKTEEETVEKESRPSEEKPKTLEHKYLENPVFNKTFAEFIEMRKKIGKVATNRAKELTLKDLEKYNINIACKMLEQSIKNSWTGVFPLKFEEEQRAQTREQKPRADCSACKGTGKLQVGALASQCFCVS